MTQERTAVGSFIATGSAMNIHLGFIPRYVRLINVTDAVVGYLEWYQGMGDGYGRKSVTNVASIIASDGISEYAGNDAEGDAAGFTFGAETDLNNGSDVIYYVVVR